MKNHSGILMSLMVAISLLMGNSANSSLAQESAKAAVAGQGKAAVKALFENDKVKVVEATFKPGDISANVYRPLHIVRALEGGTIEFTHADGRVENLVYKTGEVKVREPDTGTPKNVGNSTVVLYVVFLKDPK